MSQETIKAEIGKIEARLEAIYGRPGQEEAGEMMAAQLADMDASDTANTQLNGGSWIRESMPRYEKLRDEARTLKIRLEELQFELDSDSE